MAHVVQNFVGIPQTGDAAKERHRVRYRQCPTKKYTEAKAMNSQGELVGQGSGDRQSAGDRRAETDRRGGRDRRTGRDSQPGGGDWVDFRAENAPHENSKPYCFRAFVDRRSDVDRRKSLDRQAALDLAMSFYFSAMERTALRRRALSREEIAALLDGA